MESKTNHVLDTADLLDINISDYVLYLGDDGQLDLKSLNSVPDPEQECCEFPDEQVKQGLKARSNEKLVVKSSSDLDRTKLSDEDNNLRKGFLSALSKNCNFNKHAVYLNIQARLQKRNAEKAALERKQQTSKVTILDSSLTKFVCVFPACGGQFSKLHLLRRHQFYEHWKTLVPSIPDPAVNCALCHKKFPQNLIGAHMLGFHEKKKLAVPCCQCGDMFSQHDVFLNHMTSHSNEDFKPSQPDPISPKPSIDESISIPESVPHTLSSSVNPQIASKLNVIVQQTSNSSSSVASEIFNEVFPSTIQPAPEGAAKVKDIFSPNSTPSSLKALANVSSFKTQTIWLRSDLMTQKTPVIRPSRFKVPAPKDSTPIFKFPFPTQVRIPEYFNFSRTHPSDPKAVPALFKFESPVPISALTKPEVSDPNTSKGNQQ